MKKNSWLASPYGLWMVLFTVVPMLLVVYFSVTDERGALTITNFAKFFDPLYVGVLWRSLLMAFVCTVICLALGYPAAVFLTRKEIDRTGIMILLFVIPMWMNFLLRTYAWLALLENNGFITASVNWVASLFGFDGQIRLLYSAEAVMMGMVYNYLPFMVLPIYSVIVKIDSRVIEAAEDLGANSLQVFLRVKLPLSMPGIVSGITMVFMPAVTTFVISRLLGGGQFKLFGDLIESQFLTVNDWNFGSALSLIMMVLILISTGILSKYQGEEGAGLL
jgi:spermidine/putrescine transport system permease protein